LKNLVYIIAGMAFGIVMVKSEAISWFRIQEMFHFQSIHMFGIIGSAIATGMLSLFLFRKLGVKDWNGNMIEWPKKPMFIKSPLIGGTIFGLGWAMTGACPGPLFVNLGAGFSVFIVVIAFAVLGAFVQGLLRKKLPL
jgi:uncharacterized membrane protein YedE/YeeE